MQKSIITVDQWVELFKAVGMSEANMHQWHMEFERRFPEGHQRFLEWLDLPTDRIHDIRSRSTSKP